MTHPMNTPRTEMDDVAKVKPSRDDLLELAGAAKYAADHLNENDDMSETASFNLWSAVQSVYGPTLAAMVTDGERLKSRSELLEKLIRAFVSADRAVLSLPEDAYLDPEKLDKLTDALQKRTGAVVSLYMAARGK